MVYKIDFATMAEIFSNPTKGYQLAQILLYKTILYHAE